MPAQKDALGKVAETIVGPWQAQGAPRQYPRLHSKTPDDLASGIRCAPYAYGKVLEFLRNRLASNVYTLTLDYTILGMHPQTVLQ